MKKMLTKGKTDFVKIIEGILFASADPLSAEAINKMFDEHEQKPVAEIRKALLALQDDYKDSGIELVEVASGYRFQVTSYVAPYIAKATEERPARYSRALLETLALIAYRQPITRGEIEDIRGVVVSTQIIKTLDEHGWIKIVGHKDVPGKPALYATTKYFLDHFGLKNLNELPPLVELKSFEGFSPAHTNAFPPAEGVDVEAIENQQICVSDKSVEIEEQLQHEIETI